MFMGNPGLLRLFHAILMKKSIQEIIFVYQVADKIIRAKLMGGVGKCIQKEVQVHFLKKLHLGVKR